MSSLTTEYRLCDLPEPPKITAGLDAWVDGGIGFCRRWSGILGRLRAEALRVDALGPSLKNITDAVLKERLQEMRITFRRDEKNADSHLAEALALVREVSERQMGMRPFLVQLMGALALRRGYLAEMATGEGKTLTASLAAIMSGWTGQPCHVVTVNDYLAQRDAENLRPLYEACGVNVGYVTGPMRRAERAQGHTADVTYTTSKEIVADFLRDRICLGDLQHPTRRMIRHMLQPADLARLGVVMRGLHTAIVDEADSVLVDEAVTPLIIAGSEGNDEADDAYQAAWGIAIRLQPTIDYVVNDRYRETELTETGRQKLNEIADELPGLWRAPARRAELITQALNAREFFHRDQQYVVQDGEVVIVDEFTGRMMPMRKWRHGIHQAVEAKESVKISALDETLARLSFQRFFRFFRRLSGMTGTGREAAPEFWHIYRLPTVTIPTNRPCQRRERHDRVFADSESKWKAVVDEIERIHATGRPLLVGTRNISSSLALAERLRALGLEFELLNATRHKEEAQIVAGAGQEGRITIATNMAGRGTDIKLGRGVAELGGLHVLATERHESRRVDRQLYGRAGRQGDPGSAQAFVSAEDELLRRFTTEWMQAQLRTTLKQHWPMARWLSEAVFAYAQRTAQRQAFKARRQVLKLDNWLSEALSFVGSRKD